MKNTTCRIFALALLALGLPPIQSPAQPTYEPYTFTTLAGIGPGSTDGTGSAARFNLNGLSGVVVDSVGNVYVADTLNNTIRKVTPAGEVTTLAGLAGSFGSADGTGSEARFNDPRGVAVDSAGNLYVADSAIRKVTPDGVVTTLAEFELYGDAVAVDSAGNLYLTDGRSIQKATPVGNNWAVTTLAGSAARFGNAQGMAVDSAGNVYVADRENHTIRRVTPAGVVTTLAGLAGDSGSADGTGAAARFNYPSDVAVDGAGNVFVTDFGNSTIRKVTPVGTGWVVTTLAGLAGSFGGADGTGSEARFWGPSGVAVDSAGNLFVADLGNEAVRKMTSVGTNWVVTTFAGPGNEGSADGPGSAARFAGPNDVAVDSTGNRYVADYDNSTIRKVSPEGVVTTLAGLAGSFGSADGPGSAARFNYPGGVVVDSTGSVYVADTRNSTIRRIALMGVVTTLAGLATQPGSADGIGSAAQFNLPYGLAVDNAGNIFVADSNNNTIRRVTPVGTNWIVTTLAGLAGSSGNADGMGSAARFNLPIGVAVDSASNVYVADFGNHAIRKMAPVGTNWVVTTLAGLGSSPRDVAVDSAGNIFVADGNNTILKATPVGTNWVVTTLAGVADRLGSTDGTGNVARFWGPSGVSVDRTGNVFVADFGNSTIRKGYPALAITSSGASFGYNGGQFGFDLTGPPGQLVVVEASADLVSWLPLWTNTFAGALNFSDQPSAVYSNRFYRARSPQPAAGSP